MPDTYGKRQREGVKARKAAAREERRLRRNRRREAREAGRPDEENAWLGPPNQTVAEDSSPTPDGDEDTTPPSDED